jgi:hypothetical protein
VGDDGHGGGFSGWIRDPMEQQALDRGRIEGIAWLPPF